MTFKLYPDKSSLRKKNSRMLQGGIAEESDTFIKWWERDVLPRDDITDILYTIKKVYEFKPDLISFDYYGRNDLGWLILQYNNIVDVNEELKVGQQILLPSKNRVFFQIITRSLVSKRLIL